MRFKDKLVLRALTKSPFIAHFNSGSCNGCDIEIVATLTPRYDIERFGFVLTGTPRHADILVCTGPVTRQAEERLERFFAQMPDPKGILIVGTCAITGGVYQECFNVRGGIDKVLPIDNYPSVVVPGCPPRPEAIILGAYKLLKYLKGLTIDPPPESTVKFQEELIAPKEGSNGS